MIRFWGRRLDYTPAGEQLDREQFERDLQAAKNPAGPCHAMALERCYFYQKRGWKYWMCHGKYDGKNHKWVEYIGPSGERLIDDPAQDIYDWPRHKCKAYHFIFETVPDYRKVV